MIMKQSFQQIPFDTFRETKMMVGCFLSGTNFQVSLQGLGGKGWPHRGSLGVFDSSQQKSSLHLNVC